MKVLVIKLGYSETIDPEIGTTPSLGDVLRSTVILHKFKDDQVTWLVDKMAKPLLVGNPYIHRILEFSLLSVLQLQKEKFDIVVNLEKVPGICALADGIATYRAYYGFRFNDWKGKAVPYSNSEHVMSVCNNIELKKTQTKSWQQMLIEMVDEEWNKQEYILGYKPKTIETYEVGFNTDVGKKWPNKAWPKEKWRALYDKILKTEWTVSFQEGTDNLFEYIDWINSCKVLVTNDSLGLHIALALKKKVVVLYGPTNPNETFTYGRAINVYSEYFDCRPCFRPICERDPKCIDSIPIMSVYKAIQSLLEEK